MKDELLTVGEVAQMLRVSTRTLSRWEETGLLMPMRLPNGYRRYLASEVRAVLERADTA